MPKPRSPKLESPTSRRKLPVRKKPYQVRLAPGIALAYRRNAGPGTWSVRVSDGFGGEWLKRIGLADDLEPAAPPHVLSYWQAQEAARKLARRQPGEVIDESRPLTVAEALDAYEKDLKTRGASKYNAVRIRKHLTSVLLSKPVALLSAAELKKWRDSLSGLAPASVNRTLKALRAALEIAADHDPRITNARAWKVGLAILPDAAQARNIILGDDEVLRLIAAAYERDPRFGLLVELLATTGARHSQATRLTVGDLRLDPVAPKLTMPRSGKGGSHNRTARKAERYSVPITPELARLLAQEAAGRPPDAVLLTRNDGQPWRENPNTSYRRDFAEIVAAIGLDPEEVTAYALRHSSIVRAILANVPIRVVAARHDTSVAMIERNYSRHISEHADQYARQGLLQPVPLDSDNVIPLVGR
jgi:integrase